LMPRLRSLAGPVMMVPRDAVGVPYLNGRMVAGLSPLIDVTAARILMRAGATLGSPDSMFLPQLNSIEPTCCGPVCPMVGGWRREVSHIPIIIGFRTQI
jgi:hypothetical protein